MIANDSVAADWVIWLIIGGGVAIAAYFVYLLTWKAERTARNLGQAAEDALHPLWCTGPSTGDCANQRCQWHKENEHDNVSV